MILYRFQRRAAREDLSGHHARQAHHAGDRHGIDNRDETAAYTFKSNLADRLLPCLTKHETRLDHAPLLPRTVRQTFERNRHAVHGVAKYHPQQRNRILRLIPRLCIDDHSQH